MRSSCSLHATLLLTKYVTISAKMDATENDIPPSAPFRVSGFPTLKFKPAGSKTFVDYDGDRSLESLISFVEEHAVNKIDIPAKPLSNETTPAQEPVSDHSDAHDHHDEL